MTPEEFLQYLDAEIQTVEHCKNGCDNSYLGIMWRGEYFALTKVKEMFLTIEFDTQSTESERPTEFSEGLT